MRSCCLFISSLCCQSSCRGPDSPTSFHTRASFPSSFFSSSSPAPVHKPTLHPEDALLTPFLCLHLFHSPSFLLSLSLCSSLLLIAVSPAPLTPLTSPQLASSSELHGCDARFRYCCYNMVALPIFFSLPVATQGTASQNTNVITHIQGWKHLGYLK